jgi:hypothetical protein
MLFANPKRLTTSKPMCGYEDGIKVCGVIIVCSSGHGRRKGFGTASKSLVAHPIICFDKTNVGNPLLYCFRNSNTSSSCGCVTAH